MTQRLPFHWAPKWVGQWGEVAILSGGHRKTIKAHRGGPFLLSTLGTPKDRVRLTFISLDRITRARTLIWDFIWQVKFICSIFWVFLLPSFAFGKTRVWPWLRDLQKCAAGLSGLLLGGLCVFLSLSLCVAKGCRPKVLTNTAYLDCSSCAGAQFKAHFQLCQRPPQKPITIFFLSSWNN